MKRLRIASTFIDDRRGQTALLFLLLLLAFFMLFALALDAGFWYFDHRWAQNQAEAAALAGAYRLPNQTPTDAYNAASRWLTQNGWSGPIQISTPDRSACGSQNASPLPSNVVALVEVMNCRGTDSQYDTVRVRLRRNSLTFLSGLFGVNLAYVSASATAQAGTANSVGQVMPWALIKTADDCSFDSRPFNGDDSCYGVSAGRVYRLVCTEQNAEYCRGAQGSGNTAKLRGCTEGNRGQDEYEDCIRGVSSATGFIQIGENVYVDPLPGNRVNGTVRALEDRLRPFEGGNWADCDVTAKPEAPSSNGADIPGWNSAQYKALIASGEPPANASPDDITKYQKCLGRLVVLPIVYPPFGSGSSMQSQVAAFVTVYIAGWDRGSGSVKGTWGNAQKECGSVEPKKGDEASYFYCGVVWGYVVGPAKPKTYAGGLASEDRPLAPITVMLID